MYEIVSICILNPFSLFIYVILKKKKKKKSEQVLSETQSFINELNYFFCYVIPQNKTND
jgi:hypothetical protein